MMHGTNYLFREANLTVMALMPSNISTEPQKTNVCGPYVLRRLRGHAKPLAIPPDPTQVLQGLPAVQLESCGVSHGITPRIQ